MPSLMISPFQQASMVPQYATDTNFKPVPYMPSESDSFSQGTRQQFGTKRRNTKKMTASNQDLIDDLNQSGEQLMDVRRDSKSDMRQIGSSGGISQQEDSIIKHYTKQLMSSNRTDQEITHDLEQYYTQLCNNCDQEILRLREELQLAEAEDRTSMAEDLVIPRAEMENISNFFLECIYEQQKSLRQKLIRMNFQGDSK